MPGLTLDETMFRQLAEFLKSYDCIKRIDLLSFHKMGEYKWQELGEDYRLTDTPAPEAEAVKKAVDIFKATASTCNSDFGALPVLIKDDY